MINLIEPYFAIAGVIGAVGVVILHFLNRRARGQEFLFSNVRLLVSIIQEHLPRQRWRDRLLAIVRALCFLSILLALAKPLLRGVSSDGGASGPRDIYWFVIDVSASMGYRDAGGVTFLDRSSRAAELVAQELWRRQASARIGLVAFDRDVKTASIFQPTLNAAELRLAVSRCVLGEAQTRQSSWVSWILKNADSEKTGGVYVFSDLARHGFGEKAALDGAWDEVPVIFVTPVQGKIFNRRIRVDGRGRDLSVEVAIDCFGEISASPLLALTIADGVSGQSLSSVKVKDCSVQTLNLENIARISPSQEKALRLTLPGDDLGFDDQGFWVHPPRQNGALLIIDGEPGRRAMENESFYVREALKALRFEDPWNVITQDEAHRLAQQADFLAGVNVLWLLNPGLMGSLLRERIAGFIEQEGRFLVIASGSKQAAWDESVVRGLAMGSIENGGQGTMLPQSNAQGIWLGQRSLAQFNQAELGPIDIDQLALLSPTARVKKNWLMFKTGALAPRPILSEIDSQGGRIFFWATTMDAAWTNLPLKGFFVTLIDALIKEASAIVAPRQAYWSDIWTFDPPGNSNRELKARSPSGEAFKGFGSDGNVSMGPLMETGIYQLSWSGIRIGSAGDDWPSYLAVNFSSQNQESDPALAPDRDLKFLSGNGGLWAKITTTEIFNQPKRAVGILGGRNLSRFLLAAAFVWLLIEGFVLFWTVRERI